MLSRTLALRRRVCGLAALFCVCIGAGYPTSPARVEESTAPTPAQWTVARTSWGRGLLSVSFAGAQRGWLVGNGGTILHTADGGATWQIQDSGTDYDLTAVAFVDGQGGWAVGDGGTIVDTADGGATWRARPSRTEHRLTGVAFADARHGWAVGAGDILHTADSGVTWQTQPYSTTDDLTAVAAPDAQHAWAVSSEGRILRTMGGGATWKVWSNCESTLQSECLNFNAATFTDASNGWIGGGHGMFLHTTDGGLTWQGQFSGFIDDLLDVHFISPRVGWVLGVQDESDGASQLLRTTDGGTTWKLQVIPPRACNSASSLSAWPSRMHSTAGCAYHPAHAAWSGLSHELHPAHGRRWIHLAGAVQQHQPELGQLVLCRRSARLGSG